MFSGFKFVKPGLLFACLIAVLAVPVTPVAVQSHGDSQTPFGLEIGVLLNQPLGQSISVPVIKASGSEGMSGFDFLIGYDTSALTITGVTGGELFDIPGDFEWEYFKYRSDSFECEGNCPSSIIRAIGVASVNSPGHDPLELMVPDGTVLFNLNFQITDSQSFDCAFTPIRFFWMDCGDNAVVFADSLGEILVLSDHVYDYVDPYQDISDTTAEFPTYYGAPAECIGDSVTNPPVRFADYYNGGVEISCSQMHEDRGDINLNGIAYEISDYVVFANYFLYGLSAFTIDVDAQIAASDINGDGIITLQDFIYLIRIIEGVMMPLPSPPLLTDDFSGVVGLIETDSSIIIRTQFEDSVGGMHFTFDSPDFLSNDDVEIKVYPAAEHMDIGYEAQDGSLNILIYNLGDGPATIDTSMADILEIIYTGEKPVLNLCSAAGYLAEFVDIILAALPNFPPIFDTYPSQLTNDSSGLFHYDFDAYDQNSPADQIQYHIVGGVGEIDSETGEWIFLALCMELDSCLILEVCASDVLHPCPQSDPGLHAVIELVCTNPGPAVGDVNGSGAVNLLDITYLIEHLYKGGPPPIPAPPVGDVDSNTNLNLLDITYLINYLYRDGPEPMCP